MKTKILADFQICISAPLKDTLAHDQCSHHIETSQSIYGANQLTGFYMMGILVVKG